MTMKNQYWPRAACWFLSALACGAIDLGLPLTALALSVAGGLIISGAIFSWKRVD